MGGIACNYFLFNSTFMANNKQFYRGEHKQHGNSGMAFHNSSHSIQLPDFKRINRMAQAKMILILCDFLGIPFTLLGIVANIDNIKSAILAILAIAYLMGTGYYRFRRLAQDEKSRELDLWSKEMDKLERLAKMNEKKQDEGNSSKIS